MASLSYDDFIALYGDQLAAQSVPEALYRKVHAKLAAQNFDAGSAFAFSFDDDEDQNCRYGLVTLKDIPANSDVFLADHMATFASPDEAAKMFQSVPALAKRVATLLEIDGVEDGGDYVVQEDTETGELKAVPEHPAKSNSDLVKAILPRLWVLSASYQLDGQDPVFYILDEVGSRLQPAADPADALFAAALLADPRTDPEIPAVTIFWPVQDVGEGEQCTCRGLPNGRTRLNKLRSSLWGFNAPEQEGELETEYGTGCAELGAKFAAAGYTSDNLLSLLGMPASSAGFPPQNLSHPAARGENSVKLRKRCAELNLPEHLATLVDFFLLGLPVSGSLLEPILGQTVVDFLLDQNVVMDTPSGLVSLLQFTPLSSIVVATDFQHVSGSCDAFHPVMYVGVDTLGLAGLLPALAPKDKKVLDLCSGCGVQALLAAKLGASTCDAVEINPRACKFVRFNALVNSLKISVLEGNLYAVVEAHDYDLILANPPYIPNPAGIPLELFGDGGASGEEVLREIAMGFATHAKDGARFAAVGNLVDPAAYDKKLAKWMGKVQGRVGFGRAWTAQEYAELITPDGEEAKQLTAALEKQGVRNIANGFVCVSKGDNGIVCTKVGDEAWQLVAGILGEDARKNAVASIV